MSQWTHIRGGIEFDASPYEIKGNNDWQIGSKDVYLPYPAEQVIVGEATPYIYRDKKEGDKAGLSFETTICSLPRAKKYIDEAIKKLPQGELGWGYNLYQDINDCRRWSSDFDYPFEEKEVKSRIVKRYNKEPDYDATWKQYKDWYHIQIGGVQYSRAIKLAVREDLRDCSGDELLEALEKFFIELREHEIYLEDGYLEWEDEYNGDYIYAWRCSRIDRDINRLHSFMKLDRETNKIIWSKEYRYGLNEKGRNDYNNIIVVEKTFDSTEPPKKD